MARCSRNHIWILPKGDLIGVRGMLQTKKDAEGKVQVHVAAERVTFLSSRNIDKEDRDDR